MSGALIVIIVIISILVMIFFKRKKQEVEVNQPDTSLTDYETEEGEIISDIPLEETSVQPQPETPEELLEE